jgi:chorismate mutase/prephenate dehydratase
MMKDFEKIDKELIRLLKERQQLATDKKLISTWTKEYLKELSTGELSIDLLSAVYREIDSANISEQKETKVAFLGPATSFTNQAALNYFGHSVDYLPQYDIPAIFNKVETGEANFGVVPIENSTEGAVNRTLDALVNTEAKIVGEIRLRVHHNILAKCDRSQVEVVYSHRQALAQCHGWLLVNFPNAKLVETESTTEGARLASETENAAAIASLQAAELFNLNIIEKNIEDVKGNSTRFLVISNHLTSSTGNDKTSLLLCTKDQAGALYESLAPFKQFGVSLSMIESRPSKRQSWEYYFFIDFIGHIDDGQNAEMLTELEKICSFVKNLGSYHRAEN